MRLDFFIIVICLSFFGLGIFIYKKKFLKRTSSNSSTQVIGSDDDLSVGESEKFLSLLPKVISMSEKDNIQIETMHEIRDKQILAKINAVLSQGINHVQKKNNQKHIQNINDILSSGDLYKVIIPPEAELYKARDMIGAVRGGYHIYGQLAGQAHLLKVKPNELSNLQNIGQAGEIVANAMNVASMVVGQYYMAEVDAKLEKIQVGIDKIADFQQTNFKARILSLIAKVGKISKFNTEIIENEEMRKRSLDSLARHEDESMVLLQEVNLSIRDIITSNDKVDYHKYKEIVLEVDKLIGFQSYLTSTQEEIGRLSYLLNKGKVTSEFCYSVFDSYLNQSNEVRGGLATWHAKQTNNLGIQTHKTRIIKKGFEAAVFYLPGIVNNDLKYKKMNKTIAEKIKEQMGDQLQLNNTTDDVLSKETQIIIQNGKYYYLTE